MSLSKESESVSDAALIRAALPQHSAKRLARLMGVPFRTAKHWLYFGPARHRRRELARAMLAEMDRQDREERARARVYFTHVARGG